MNNSKSETLKASTSITNTNTSTQQYVDPPLIGLRTNSLVHKSSTSKLKLNASFKMNTPNSSINPNLKQNFGDLPPLLSKEMRMNTNQNQ